MPPSNPAATIRPQVGPACEGRPQESFGPAHTVPEPCGIVIFGASGDLAHRKLFPALFSLLHDKVLPKSFYVLGVARSAFSDDGFRSSVQKSLPGDAGSEPSFLPHLYYLSGGYDDPRTYEALKQRLASLDKEYGIQGRHLFYFSMPPALYETIAAQLGRAGLVENRGHPQGWVRLVVEKPFGYSLSSAEELNSVLHRVFRESQIYRIDHYLGKETVQNILMFRFANAIYEPVWNRKYIDQIQITSAETVGVEHRAGYYDGAGALRDMFQNHLFQLLSLVAMEPPCSFEAEAVRDEKAKVMASLAELDARRIPERAIRAQYA